VGWQRDLDQSELKQPPIDSVGERKSSVEKAIGKEQPSQSKKSCTTFEKALFLGSFFFSKAFSLSSISAILRSNCAGVSLILSCKGFAMRGNLMMSSSQCSTRMKVEVYILHPLLRTTCPRAHFSSPTRPRYLHRDVFVSPRSSIKHGTYAYSRRTLRMSYASPNSD